jgi:hypothetical protein
MTERERELCLCEYDGWDTRLRGCVLHPPAENIETVAYQAAALAANRPCRPSSCELEFPGRPSRWCSGCIVSALLRKAAR